MSQGLIKVKVTFRGTSPLLFNALTDEELQALYYKTKKPRNAEPPLPRVAAEKRVYQKDGKPYMPFRHVMACLITAGRFVRLDGKKQVSSATSTVMTSFLSPLVDSDTRWWLEDKDGNPSEWETDMMAGKNPNGGDAVCIVRPRFDDWRFTATFLLNTEELAEVKIRELFDKAGKCAGLGDFRPARRGTYGMWVVECWEHVKDEIPEAAPTRKASRKASDNHATA